MFETKKKGTHSVFQIGTDSVIQGVTDQNGVTGPATGTAARAALNARLIRYLCEEQHVSLNLPHIEAGGRTMGGTSGTGACMRDLTM